MNRLKTIGDFLFSWFVIMPFVAVFLAWVQVSIVWYKLKIAYYNAFEIPYVMIHDKFVNFPRRLDKK